MLIFGLYVCASHVCLVSIKTRAIKVSVIRITDDCKLSCGYWKLNLGPVREQKILLTMEPSFQFQKFADVIGKYENR